MEWEVRGASKTTGLNCLVRVEAADRQAAAEMAAKEDMYVESITPKPDRAPSYDSLKNACNFANGLGWLASGAGVFAIAGGIICLAIAAARGGDSAAAAIADARMALSDGVFTLIGGVLMRVLALIGLAVRDAARNSFVRKD